MVPKLSGQNFNLLSFFDRGLGLAWRPSETSSAELQLLVALESLHEIFSCHQSVLSSPSPFKGSKKSPDEKRARAECYKIFEALDMTENLGVKIEASWTSSRFNLKRFI